MKRFIYLLLTALILSSCSQKPSDDLLAKLIEDSMREEMPPHVMGTLAGGQLIELEEIEIEQVEKAKYEPNAVFKAFGSKSHDYWKVLARVKGIGSVGVGNLANTMLYGSENRGFHARSVWSIRQIDDGKWKTSFAIDVHGIEQPASPSWWKISNESGTEQTKNNKDATHPRPSYAFIGDWYDGGSRLHED